MNHESLRALCLAATPGPWSSTGFAIHARQLGWVCIADVEMDNQWMAENAAYIAAMDPTTTLALLDEIERLRTAAQAVVDRWDTPNWKDVPATATYINKLRMEILK